MMRIPVERLYRRRYPVLSKSGAKPVSFDYAIGTSVNVRVAQDGAKREGEESTERKRVRGLAWCSVVIINPQWLTRLRTFMIHANGSATRSTRSHTYASQIFNTYARVYRMPLERARVSLWMRMHVRLYVCVQLLMALGHANLVVRSSTPEKPRPTLLFGKKSVSHEGERAFILLMDFLN